MTDCCPSPQGLISVSDARERMVTAVQPVDATETVSLADALGRVLVNDICSPINVPPADNSAMDGYAVRFDDLATGKPLPVSARIQAGAVPEPLAPGTAARIFTGAVVPDGADTVVIQENCREEAGALLVEKPPGCGANIRRAGEDIAREQVVLASGICLQARHLGLLASVGFDRVDVRRRLKVQVLSTGDELVPPGQALGPGQIYNSNDAVLDGLLRGMGCEVLPALRVPDSAEATREALLKARERADLVLTSGGVSVGEADFVKPAVEALGSLDLWKINIKPGKPVAFGYLDGARFIGLPGNPVSVFATFCLFAAPVIRRLQGRSALFPDPLRLPASFTLPAGKREEYQRVRVEDGQLIRYPHQGSGVMSSVAWAHGLARVPADTAVAVGDELEFFDFWGLTG